MAQRAHMGTVGPDFDSIHRHFRPRVLRYLTRLVGSQDAEDLTQSVMLKVSAGLPGFRGDSSVSTWIYRIATNAAADCLRRRPQPAPSDLDFGPDESDVPPDLVDSSAEATAVHEEMNACIRDFIERLPADFRAVMVLSELEGFKNREIAAIVGVSLDTVKIRLHRAREKLRRELEAGCSFYRDERDELACDRAPAAVVKFRPRT